MDKSHQQQRSDDVWWGRKSIMLAVLELKRPAIIGKWQAQRSEASTSILQLGIHLPTPTIPAKYNGSAVSRDVHNWNSQRNSLIRHGEVTLLQSRSRHSCMTVKCRRCGNARPRVQQTVLHRSRWTCMNQNEWINDVDLDTQNVCRKTWALALHLDSVQFALSLYFSPCKDSTELICWITKQLDMFPHNGQVCPCGKQQNWCKHILHGTSSCLRKLPG